MVESFNLVENIQILAESIQIKITAIHLNDTLIPNKYNSNNHHILGVTYGHVLTEEEYSAYKVQFILIIFIVKL
jgi:hypothetical protein